MRASFITLFDRLVELAVKQHETLTVDEMDEALRLRELLENDKIRLLQRVSPLVLCEDPGYPKAMFLDTETTGLDPLAARVIELAYVVMTYDPETLKLRKPVALYDGFQDPGHELSQETTELTGITTSDVQGQSLDKEKIKTDLAACDFVVAHNAGFDRKFCEMELTEFCDIRWACSFADINWKKLGFGSSKLEFIGFVSGYFYDAHRAIYDVEAMIEFIDCNDVFASLYNGAQSTVYRVAAMGAPFSKKDTLKNADYKPFYKEGKFLFWYKTFATEGEAQKEKEYLLDEIFCSKAPITAVTAIDRFSAREMP